MNGGITCPKHPSTPPPHPSMQNNDWFQAFFPKKLTESGSPNSNAALHQKKDPNSPL